MSNIKTHFIDHWKHYSVISVISLVIFLGFNSTHGKIMGCYAQSDAYVLAEYSEVTTSICTDTEGNVSTCSSTDSWSKPASVVWSNTTINGELTSSNMTEANKSLIYETNHGIYTTSYPPHDESKSRDSDFDNFSFHQNIKHTVRIKEPDNFSQVTKDLDFYPNCLRLKKAGFSLKVKTWYGISYDVEEFNE
jgi:hypothetical protein